MPRSRVLRIDAPARAPACRFPRQARARTASAPTPHVPYGKSAKRAETRGKRAPARRGVRSRTACESVEHVRAIRALQGAVTAAPLRIFGAGGLPRPSAFAPTTPPNWHSRVAPRNTPEPGRAGERMRGWAAHIGPDRCSWRKRPAEPALHAAQHRRSASLKRFACKAGRETAAERETCGAM